MHKSAEAGALRAFAPALALLLVAVVVNYVDRGNLSIAAPLLKEEWHISPSQLGVLFSAFFWTYTAMQLVSGWVVDRFDVNRVIALGYVVWSLATAATGLARDFAMLLVMRLLLGIGESVIIPGSSKILARSLPESSRGIANGLLFTAMQGGAVVGTLGCGLLMARYGWRPAFIGTGLVSLLWLPAWRRWMPRSRVTTAVLGMPKMIEIARRRSFWGAASGAFCISYLLYFTVMWLPFYLVHERHLTLTGMTKMASLYYLTNAVVAALTGLVTDLCIRRGGSPSLVRKSAMALGWGIAAVSLGLWAAAGMNAYQSFMLFTAIGAGISSSGSFAFAQTLAGPQAAGQWVGMQNFIGNLAGVIGPALTGVLVERTGHFAAALAVMAVISVLGGLSWVFWVGRLEEQTWATADAVLIPLADSGR